MKQYKYIVWVGGTPNYFDNHTDAVCEKLEWQYKGYDDVHIEEVENETI